MNSTIRLPENVRISTRGREILIKLKRFTGIQHWNTLCRVAYCRSLSMPTPPAEMHQLGDTALEIEWQTFVGPIGVELAAATWCRMKRDQVAQEEVSQFVRAHLERGLASIQKAKKIVDLIVLNDN